MKPWHRISLFIFATVFTSCSTVDKPTNPTLNSHTNSPVESVFPRFTVFPSTHSLPSRTIYNLPNQIELLKSDSNITLKEFLSKLGLKNYKQNLSANMRWNHYFVYVDENSVLYIEVDVAKLDNTLDWFKPDLNVPIVSCRLLKNPGITLAQWKK